VLDGLTPSQWSIADAVRDADYYKLEALRAFKLGLLSLEDRVAAEELVAAVHRRARSFASLHALVFPADGTMPSNLDNNKTISNGGDRTGEVRTLHVNMSVFRSAVDCWAIGQVFPIVPLSRLDEEPTERAVLADLTCDSDGKLDTFINPSGGAALKALPVHMGGRAGDPYRLAMFLTGVYQETMGSPHNLFGSLNSATIRLRPSRGLPVAPSSLSLCSETGMGSECSQSTTMASGVECAVAWVAPGGLEFVVERVVQGESVATVLSRVGHDAAAMLRSVRSMATGVAESGRASADVVDAAMAYVQARMEGYTYMAS
jgi:arginine decarboxylase